MVQNIFDDGIAIVFDLLGNVPYLTHYSSCQQVSKHVPNPKATLDGDLRTVEAEEGIVVYPRELGNGTTTESEFSAIAGNSPESFATCLN